MTLKQFYKKNFCSKSKLDTCPEKETCPIKGSPLSQQCQRGRFKVCKVKGDRKHCAKMASLGLIPGKEMELICSEIGSQCIIKVHGGQLTLDKVTSENILVSK